MNELRVVVKQETGTIVCNFDELKKAVADELETYKGRVYDDDSISFAKADVAKLRKLKKELGDKRKEIKNKCLEPYNEFEAQINELNSIIDEPIEHISACVSNYETEQKEKKRAAITDYLNSVLADAESEVSGITEAVKRIRYDTRWENKSTAKTKWQGAIDEIAESVTSDIRLIQGMDADYKQECLNVYIRTLSLNAAVEKQTEMQRQKEILMERQRQHEEARQRAAEQERKDLRAELTTIDAEREKARQIEIARQTNQREPRRDYRVIRILSTAEQYEKILSFIRYTGAEYQEA